MPPTVSVPKVSVIMPVYKPDFMAQAIDSILAQTMRDFELILVNDGSPHLEVREIANDYARRDSRIRYIEQDNQGLAGARNTAASAAVSPYLMVMDDDDLSLPDRMLRQYEFLQDHPEVAAVKCANDSIDNEGNIKSELGKAIVKKKAIIQNEPASPTSGESILQFNGVATRIRKNVFFKVAIGPATMIRKKAFASIGGMRPFFKIHEDTDFFRRLEEKYPVARIPDVLYHYRIHSSLQQLTKHKNALLYFYAAETAAYFRRQGKGDPIDDGTTLDNLVRLFPKTSPAMRHGFIRKWMKATRKSLPFGDYEQIKKDIIFYRNLFIEDKKIIKKAVRKIAINAFFRGHWRALFSLVPTP